MSILSRFARKWFQRNQGVATRIPLHETKSPPQLEAMEDRVVPTITFNYDVVATGVLGMIGNASADQYTLTNDTTKYYFSSDNTSTFGNDATLDASSVSTPPKQSVGGVPATTNIAFDNTVKLAFNPGSGSDFWLDRDINAVLLNGSGKISSYPFGTGDYTLTITGLSGASGNYAGKIINGGSGSLALTMNQAGATQKLSGSNSYTGATKVLSGNLTIDGSINSASPVSVSGGALKGTGTVGVVTLTGGALAPGDDTGTLNSGNLSFNSNSSFAASFKSSSLYSAVKVTGTVNLGGAKLTGSFIGGFTPTPGDKYTLINNDGTDKITGSFSGLPEGSTATLSGNKFTISYVGGDGNDVVLTAKLSNQAPAITSTSKTTFVQGSLGTFAVTTSGTPVPTITEDGALPSGVSFVDNGNGTAKLSGTPAAGSFGTYPITFTASNGINPDATQNFTLTVGISPTFTNADKTTFVVGTNGNFPFTADGYPTAMTFSTTDPLPTGVTLAADGTLAGTPAAGTGGVYTITAKASNGVAPDATQNFTLTVNVPPVYGPGRNLNFNASTGVAFTGSFAATDGSSVAYALSSGMLPVGLTLDPTTGVISGTPINGGTFSFQITASNTFGSATSRFSIAVLPSLPGQFVGNGAAIISGSAQQNATNGSFAVLKSDGSISSWGNASYGGTGAPTGTGFTQIFSNLGAFAALKLDGSIKSWGNSTFVGTGAPTGTGFTQIFSSGGAFTALKADGSVSSWGYGAYGGTGAPTGTGFTQVFGTIGAFAALKPDGSITAWGNSSYGGTGAPTGVGYTRIFATQGAFAALKSDGSIAAWGDPSSGSTGVPTGTGFTQVFAAQYSFAALKSDGSIKSWGVATAGGTGAPTGTGYSQIFSTGYAFAALKKDGSVSGWGDINNGGTGAPTGTGFTQIASGYSAFAGLRADGSIVAWGQAAAGGTGAPTGTGFTQIFGNQGSFSALKADGSIRSWGDNGFGGTGAPTGTGYTQIIPNYSSYAALKSDGTITAWGDPSNGGTGAPTGSGFLHIQSIFVDLPYYAPGFNNQLSEKVNISFSDSVAAVGLYTAYTLTSGALPSGVTLDQANGIISGTATSTGEYDFTITASNSVGSVNQPFHLSVKATTQAPAITSADKKTFVEGTSGNFVITTTGTPTATISENGTLPSGVTFVDNGDGTAKLSGTPAAGTQGIYPISFTAANGVNPDATQNFTLTIGVPPTFTSVDKTTFVVGAAGTFSFTATGFPAAMTYTTTDTLPAGVLLAADGTLSGTPGTGTGGVYTISVKASNGVAPDATQNFTLTVNQAPSFTNADHTTFVVGAAGTFQYTISGYPTTATYSTTGTLPGGVTLGTDGKLSGTPDAATGGTYQFTVKASNGVDPDATQNFTLTVNQAPAITSIDHATFTVGAAGTFTVTTTGFPVSALGETGALPTGVTFTDNGDGTATLGGNPAAGTGGTFSLNLKGSNGVNPDATQTFTLTVNEAPTLTNTNHTTFVVGAAGTFQYTISGYPTTATYSTTGTLPSGVTLGSDGKLSGTPDAATGGTYQFTVKASNGINPDATQNFTLTVNQAPAITSLNSTTFTVGAAGTFTVTTTGFPVSTLGETGALPTGVTFTDNGDGTGTLSGTPAASTGGVYSISFGATNGVNPDATQPFTLTINQAPAFTNLASALFKVGSAGTFQYTISGYPTTATYSTTGTLPSGVTLGTDGKLSGTPAVGTGGQYQFTVIASNGVNPDANQNFTLTVNEAPTITSANTTTFNAGLPGNFQFVSTGYPASFSYQIISSAGLPSGVTLSPTGLLSGTPAANVFGDFPVTVQSSNEVSPAATQNFVLHVNPAGGVYTYDQTTKTLTISLSDDAHLEMSETGGVVSFTVSKNGSTVILAAAPGSDVLSGNGTSTITVGASGISTSVTINNTLSTTTGTDNPFSFTSGKISTGAFNVDLGSHKGIGGVKFGTTTELDLTGALDVKANANVLIGGNLIANSAKFQFQDKAYDLSLTGSTTVLTSATFGNGQQITLGDEATDTITVQNGVDTMADTATNLGGTINTSSTPINMTGVKLLANTVLDTRGGGAGSSITLSGGLTQNGFTLTTYAAPDKTTTITGNLNITDPITAVTGGIVFGDGITPTTITFGGDSTLTSLTGEIGFGDKTSVVTGPNKVVFVSDNIIIDPNTTFTGTGTLGFSPANSGVNTYLGDSAGTPLPGLKFSQNTLNQFPDTYNNIQFGQEGYDGLITVGTTNSNNPITLINNGGGGKVHIDGKFTINGADAAGNGLVIIGSGHTTVISADIVTAGAAIIIDDAVQLDASVLLDTTNGGGSPIGADVILTGGTAGIYSTKGATNNLEIDAGLLGAVTLGAFHGFDNNSFLASDVNNLTVHADSLQLANNPNFLSGDLEINLSLGGTVCIDASLHAGNLYLNGGSSLCFEGTLDLYGEFVQTGTATIEAEANVIALGGVTLTGPLFSKANVAIVAGPINLTSIDANGFDLTLNGNASGTPGSIAISDEVSNVNGLTILGASKVSFDKAVSAATLTISGLVTSATFADNVTVAGALTTSKDAFGVSLLGSKNTLGSANLGNTGNFTFGDGDNDATTITGSLSRTSPTLIQGSLTSGGDLSLGGVSATTANGKMTLTANSVTFGNFGATTPSDLVIAANGPVIAGSLTAKTLNLTGATTVNQTGGWVVSGQSNITGTGAVILDSNANKFTTLGISGTVISVNNSVGLVLSGAKTINNLSVNTSGDLTQTGALSVGGASSFTAVGSVTLADPTNSFVGAVSGKGTNISLFNSRDLTLGTVTGNGNLIFNTSDANGNITQTGVITALSGNTTINAGKGNIVLTNALNDFAAGAPLSLNATDATIVVQNSMVLGTSSISRDLDITAPNGLNQANAITVGRHVRVNSQGQINLPSSNNSFPSIQIPNGQSALIVTNGALGLDGIYLTGALTLIPGGDIHQTGPVQLPLPGAQVLIIAGGFNVDLPDSRNDSFLMNITAKTVNLVDANDLMLVGSKISDLTLKTGQTVNLNSNTISGGTTITSGLDITGGGNTFTSDTHLKANQNIHLDADVNTFGTTVDFSATDVSIQAKGDAKIRFGTANGSLNFSSTGSITQSNAGTDHIEVVGPATISAGNDIQLNVATNKFQGPLALSGKNISVTNAVATTLGTTAATGDLAIVAKGFGISQNGNISATGKASFDAGTGDILLGGSNTISQVSLTGNKITFATGSAVVVNALNTTSDVSLSAPAGFTFPNDLTGVNRLLISNLNANSSFKGVLSANQLVVLSGSAKSSLTLEGNATLTGGLTAAKGSYNIAFLGSDNTIGSVSLANDGKLTLGNQDTDRTSFTGNAGLAVQNLSVLIQGSVISVGDLTLLGWSPTNPNGVIELVSNNLFLFNGDTPSPLFITTMGDANILGNVSAGTTNIRTNGTVHVNAPLNITGDLVFRGGSILQGELGGLNITGNAALVASGNIRLDNGNILNGQLQFVGNDVTFAASGQLNINIWNGSLPPAVQNFANGNLVLQSSSDIIATTPVGAGGTSQLTSFDGSLQFGMPNDFRGPVTFQSAVNASIRNIQSLQIAGGTAGGDLTLGVLFNPGNITQTGAIIAPNGVATLAVFDGDILLGNPLNDFGNKAALNISANKGTISDANKVNLGSIKTTGAFNLTAGGDITQSGSVQAGTANFTSTGDIVLQNTANAFGPLSATGKNIKATSSGALTLSDIHALGDLTLSTGGHLTQTGPIIANSEGAITTINAPGFNVTLDDSRNDFNQLTIAAGANVILTEANDFVVNNSQILGNLSIASTGSTGLYSNNIGGFANIKSGEDINGGSNTISNVSFFNATGSVLLDNFNNTFLGGNEFIGSVVSVKASGDLKLLGGRASTALSLVSTGSIIQDASQGSFNLSGKAILQAANDISFTNDQNVFVGNISATGNNIEIHNSEKLNLSGITAQNNLILKGVGISQSGPLSVSGTTNLDGGTGDILLGGANSLKSTTLKGNNVTLHTTGDMLVDTLTAAGNANLTSDKGISNLSANPLSVSGFTNLQAGDSINLGSDNSFARTVAATSTKGAVTIHAITNLITESVLAATSTNLSSTKNVIVQGPIDSPITILSGSGTGSSLNGTISGNMATWSGTGSLNISGVQNITDEFKVASGVVRTLGNNLFQNSATLEVLDNALFNLDGHVQTFNGLNGAGSVSLGSLANAGNLILENSTDALFSGVISGEGTLYKTGISKQTLTGANTFKGDTRIQEGTLQLGDTVRNGSVAGTIYVGDAVLAFRPGLDQKVTNPIVSLDQATPDVGLITLETPANAILTIAGKNQFVGKTNILEGTLNLTSNLANTTVNGSKATLTGTGTISGNLNALLGTIAPGNVDGTGKLNVTGEAVLTAQSTLLIGLASNSVYGLLNAGKTTLQNGNLVVKVASGYTPPDLQTYTVLQANPTVTGQFAQKTVVFSDPYYFKTTYNTNTVVLQKVPSGVLPGATPLIVAPASGISEAVIYNSSNQVRAKIQPMGAWTGGMRTAVGDINGDGWDDYIFAAGAGGSPRVVVIDGVTLKTVSSFFAYSPSFTGGLYVAVGDINGNGKTDIITGAGAGGGPHVQAFDAAGKSTGTSFFAYSPSFTGGVTVATGDLNGDGTAEIITGAASHGGSHVQSFHANGTNAGLSFFAYASSFLGGVNVAAGDLNGDGMAEIITGPGFTGAPNLKVFSSQGTTLSSIYTTLPSFTGGITVGAINPTNGSKFQVVTAPMSYASTYPGPRVFNYDLDAGTLVFVTSILAYPQGYYGGIWVA